MLHKQRRTNAIFVSATALGLLLCCKPKASDHHPAAVSADPDSGPEAVEGGPTIGNLASGGLPTAEEASTFIEFENTEVQAETARLHTVVGSLAIGLDGSAAALRLQGNDECKDALFCFAKAFATIYDMVTRAAQCNFDLLLSGEGLPKKIDGYPVYYVEGFGVIGLGEKGAQTCPEVSVVKAWADKIEANVGSDEDGEFYFPMRIVMFKKSDGHMHWRIVFFPVDNMKRLAKTVKPFERLLAANLDFIGFHGHHDLSQTVGAGAGEVILDFNEFVRMTTTLDEAFPPKPGEEPDTSPSGKIEIVYDMSSDPSRYTTTFLDNFSFGDGESPFDVGKPTTILKSAATHENYLHFYSGKPFVDSKDETADENDPFHTVQFCTTDKYVKDIPKAEYLPNADIHVQMLWSDVESGQSAPANYITRIASLKGGPYIYGDNVFEAAFKSGTTLNALRFKAPICDSVSGIDLAPEYNSDGFKNAEFQDENTVHLLSSGELLARFPVFDTFQFIEDFADSTQSPLKSVWTKPLPIAAFPAVESARCVISSGICWDMAGATTGELTVFKYACQKQDTNDGGFAGTYTANAQCSDTGMARVCSVTNGAYGPNLLDIDMHFATDGDFSANSSYCTYWGGVIVPAFPTSGTCVVSSNCFHWDFAANAHATMVNVCHSNLSGTWTDSATCSSSSLVGTCNYTWSLSGGAISAQSSVAYYDVGPWAGDNGNSGGVSHSSCMDNSNSDKSSIFWVDATP